MDVFGISPPARTVSAQVKKKDNAPGFIEHVVLTRVVYSDGSVWQKP